jgi:hypothetical protein
MKAKLAMIVAALACTGYVKGQNGQTQSQVQLDMLTCKDQARLEANSAGRQAGSFFLGMTIVGVPVAYELEKKKTREVYAECMTDRGYKYTAPE